MDTGTGTVAPHLERARQVVGQLTLQQKATLCSGANPWETEPLPEHGVTAAVLADGPHGLRRPESSEDASLHGAQPATCFPTASALAATWDPALVAEVGAAIGAEAAVLGVDVVLGPGANIKRSPLCGRNFEYFSEDPFLSGRLAAAHVAGVQSTGVGTSLKHFVANNQETRRMVVDAVVDERTLREVYLAGFEHAVRASQPWTVMCSYNRINGTYASDHHHLLTEVLRDDWGFEGLVMSDWGATNDRAAAVRAGLDLEMPGPVGGAAEEVVAAVRDGLLDEAALDAVAARVVALGLRAGAQRAHDATVDLDENHALARRVAARACVLLRDDGGLLPVGEGRSVAVLGAFATDPRFQGTGSSRINPTRVDDLRTELGELLGAERVTHAPGYDAPDEVDRALVAEAVAAARGADVAVVVVGLPDAYENEGDDRAHLRLPVAHDALVAAVAAAHERVVVVVVSGAPVEMPWVDDVEAVVAAYLGGQAGGGGLADVLAGVQPFTGRLAETWPARLADVPSTTQFPGGRATVEYREGVYVGYRFHDTVDGAVLFPFGHGLGAGNVEWGEPTVDVDAIGEEELAADATVTVTVPLRNDGDRPATEIVQVYVRDVESAVHRPDRELKGFATTTLAPGAGAEPTVTLDRRAFAWWDVATGRWVVEGGTFELLVAASSRDVRATLTVDVDGATVERRDEPAVYTDPPTWMAVDAASFEAVLGRPLPDPDPPVRPFDRTTALGDLRAVPQGRLVHAAVERAVRHMLGDAPEAEPLVRSMAYEAPVRALVMHGVTLEQVDALVDVLNGRWGRGSRRALAMVTDALKDR